MAAGTSRHMPSLIPSYSSQAALHSDSAGSIGLIYLHLGGTSFGASDLPTPVYSPLLDPQPGDRDDYGRCYLIPFATGFRPDAKVGQAVRKCIYQNFNCYWTSWPKVPELDRERMLKNLILGCKRTRPLDDISTDEDMKDENKFDEDDF
ncbi:hypothetical protein FXO38_15748 [Capsicum annuum]|nr:hypothetical protein FXO38_15748 [Capsicum annuum]